MLSRGGQRGQFTYHTLIFDVPIAPLFDRVGDSRDSFPADFAAYENGFVGTRPFRRHQPGRAGTPCDCRDRPAPSNSPQIPRAPAAFLESRPGVTG
jgi:hypothetical protein